MHRPDDFRTLSRVCVLVSAVCWTGAVPADGDAAAGGDSRNSNATYDPVSRGTRTLALGEVTIRMLIDESNIGRQDVEIGELVLPAGTPDSALHAHGALEIFYVVEGVLGHEVNGKLFTLNPGDVGYVKPGDQIVHRVLSDGPVKAVVVWVPGGEAAALVEHAGFVERPLNK